MLLSSILDDAPVASNPWLALWFSVVGHSPQNCGQLIAGNAIRQYIRHAQLAEQPFHAIQ